SGGGGISISAWATTISLYLDWAFKRSCATSYLVKGAATSPLSNNPALAIWESFEYVESFSGKVENRSTVPCANKLPGNNNKAVKNSCRLRTANCELVLEG